MQRVLVVPWSMAATYLAMSILLAFCDGLPSEKKFNGFATQIVRPLPDADMSTIFLFLVNVQFIS
jgi:hypothetical protein